MHFIKLFASDCEALNVATSDNGFLAKLESLQVSGFETDMHYYQFIWHLRNGKKGSTICYCPDTSGDFHIGIQLCDNKLDFNNDREIAFYINDNLIGSFNFSLHDEAYYMFFTSRKISIKKGDCITFKVIKGTGVQIQNLLFVRDDIYDIPNKIENLIIKPTEADYLIYFTTAKPSKIQLKYGDITKTTEEFLENHKFSIAQKNNTAFITITAIDEDKKIVVLNEHKLLQFKNNDQKENTYRRLPLLLSCQLDTILETIPSICSIPVRKGELFNLETLSLYDENHTSYPLQPKATSFWEDNSIKTISAHAIIKSGQKYFIEYGGAPKKQAVKNSFYILESDDYFIINNNNIVFSINKSSVNFLENISIDNKQNDSIRSFEIILKDLSNHSYTAQNPDLPWTIKEEGPSKISLLYKGHFTDLTSYRLFEYSLIISIFNNIPGIKVDFSFANDITHTEFTGIKSLYMNIALNPKTIEKEYFIQQINEHEAVEKNLPDADIQGELTADGVYLKVKDFKENYPKSLEASKEGFSIGICPSFEKKWYTTDDLFTESKLYYYLRKGYYEFHFSMRKTHEIAIVLGSDYIRSKDYANALLEPALLTATPIEYEQSASFGNLKVVQKDIFPEYEALVDEGYRFLMFKRNENREYGMLNFGDWHGERKYNWGNLEYDLPCTYLIQFLRSNDIRFYKAGKTAADHLSDVDHIYYHPDQKMVGYSWLHSIGHTDHYYTKQELNHGFPINIHTGHLFSQGFIDYYKVIGDERYLYCAKTLAETLSKNYTCKTDFVAERESAWVLFSLLGMYEQNYDPYYLNACKIITKRIYEKLNKKTGTLLNLMDRSECDGNVVYGGKPFMCGILMSVLSLYYRYTNDAKACEIIINHANWLVRDMWDEKTEGFYYTSYHAEIDQNTKPEINIEIIEGISHAYTLKPDPEHLAIIYKAFRSMVLMGVNYEKELVKDVSMKMRFSPQIIAFLFENNIVSI